LIAFQIDLRLISSKKYTQQGSVATALPFLIGFSKPGCFQRLGRFAPLSFTAYGGKIQATRFAGGR